MMTMFTQKKACSVPVKIFIHLFHRVWEEIQMIDSYAPILHKLSLVDIVWPANYIGTWLIATQ